MFLIPFVAVLTSSLLIWRKNTLEILEFTLLILLILQEASKTSKMFKGNNSSK
jgi:hypothetical protein